MNPAVLFLLYALGLTYATWVFFLAVMHLAKAKKAGTLTRTALVLGMPVLVVGFVLDFLLNVTVMSLVLLELPQELTVSARLKRHHAESSGWRLAVAHWFEPLLDPYDPDGDHI